MEYCYQHRFFNYTTQSNVLCLPVCSAKLFAILQTIFSIMLQLSLVIEKNLNSTDDIMHYNSVKYIRM